MRPLGKLSPRAKPTFPGTSPSRARIPLVASAANSEARAALYKSDSPITSSDVRWGARALLERF